MHNIHCDNSGDVFAEMNEFNSFASKNGMHGVVCVKPVSKEFGGGYDIRYAMFVGNLDTSMYADSLLKEHELKFIPCAIYVDGKQTHKFFPEAWEKKLGKKN